MILGMSGSKQGVSGLVEGRVEERLWRQKCSRMKQMEMTVFGANKKFNAHFCLGGIVHMIY